LSGDINESEKLIEDTKAAPSSAEGAALLRQHASGWLGKGVTVIQRNSSNARE